MFTERADFMLHDDNKADYTSQMYFCCLRSQYLALQVQGDRFIIEPYSPHRFSRQFGYYQYPPGVLRRDVRNEDLLTGVRYCRMNTCTKTNEKVWVPRIPTNVNSFSSSEYKDWWSTVHGNTLSKDIELLCNLKPCEVSKEKHIDKPSCASLIREMPEDKSLEIISSPAKNGNKRANPIFEADSSSSNADRNPKRKRSNSKASEQMVAVSSEHTLSSHQSPKASAEVEQTISKSRSRVSSGREEIQSVVHPPKITKALRNKTTHHPAVSVFEGKSVVLDFHRQSVQASWNFIIKKLSGIDLDSISSIRGDIQYIIDSWKIYTDVDTSHLKCQLVEFFDKASSYDAMRSSISDKLSEDSLQYQIEDAENRLQDVCAKVKEDALLVKSTKKELHEVEKRREELIKS